MAIIVPKTADAPPIPASEPTDLPECKSLGIVWIFVIVIWKPPNTKAINITATKALVAITEAITAGTMMTQPSTMANFLEKLTVFPFLIIKPEIHPPKTLPIIAPTYGIHAADANSIMFRLN